MQEHVFQFSRSSGPEFLLQRMFGIRSKELHFFSNHIASKFCGTSLKSWLKDFSAKLFKLHFADFFFFVSFVAKRLNNVCFFYVSWWFGVSSCLASFRNFSGVCLAFFVPE